jgi:hypothetical protein
MKYYLIYLIFVLLVGIPRLFADLPQPERPASAHLIKFKPNPSLQRTISLDVGYLPNLNSNRAIGEFDLELRQAWGCAYDYVYNDFRPTTLFGRTLVYGLFNAAIWGPTMGQMATYHELGHSTRFRSIGIDTNFINIGKAAWNIYIKDDYNLTLEDILSDGYFPTAAGTVLINLPIPFAFLLSGVLPRYDRPSLFRPLNEQAHYNPKTLSLFKYILNNPLKRKYDPKKDKDLIFIEHVLMQLLHEEMFTPGTAVLIHAGGLNNQQDQSRRIENHLWYNEGDHFTTVGTYFWDKTWAGFQSVLSKDNGYSDNQDTTHICRDYARMGLDVTHEEIITYSYLSYFLSAQTYANIYQVYSTLTTGENRVYAPEYWNIKLPNVGLYFTTKGPTYNVSSGYRINNNCFIPISIEFGLKQSAWEAMVGIRKKFLTFHNAFIHADVVFNSEAVGGSLYGGMLMNKLWNVQAGITYHNAKTLQGERNIPSYKTGESDIEAWIKLGIAY